MSVLKEPGGKEDFGTADWDAPEQGKTEYDEMLDSAKADKAKADDIDEFGVDEWDSEPAPPEQAKKGGIRGLFARLAGRASGEISDAQHEAEWAALEKEHTPEPIADPNAVKEPDLSRIHRVGNGEAGSPQEKLGRAAEAVVVKEKALVGRMVAMAEASHFQHSAPDIATAGNQLLESEAGDYLPAHMSLMLSDSGITTDFVGSREKAVEEADILVGRMKEAISLGTGEVEVGDGAPIPMADGSTHHPKRGEGAIHHVNAPVHYLNEESQHGFNEAIKLVRSIAGLGGGPHPRGTEPGAIDPTWQPIEFGELAEKVIKGKKPVAETRLQLGFDTELVVTANRVSPDHSHLEPGVTFRAYVISTRDQRK